MKGVGGIGLGAAEALYVASSHGCGLFRINVKVVVGLNGWLPDLRCVGSSNPNAIYKLFIF